AKDGIRGKLVTGVQTCALPIYIDFTARLRARRDAAEPTRGRVTDRAQAADQASAACKRAGFHVDRVGAGTRVQPGALNRIVDDRSEERRVGKESGSQAEGKHDE